MALFLQWFLRSAQFWILVCITICITHPPAFRGVQGRFSAPIRHSKQGNLGEPKMSKAVQEIGAAYVPPSIDNPPMLAGEGAELFDIVARMDGLGTFADEIKNCVNVRLGHLELKVLSLERILASKIAANRAKDKLTIPVLQDALATTQSVRRRKQKQ